jgi:hypothetical protein
MVYLGIALFITLVAANLYFLKYYILRIRLDFLSNLDFDELIEHVSKEIQELNPKDYGNAMDLRGTPTHVCPCGCNVWNVKVTFDDFEIGSYFLDMECANCGSLATAPTPIDKEIK